MSEWWCHQAGLLVLVSLQSDLSFPFLWDWPHTEPLKHTSEALHSFYAQRNFFAALIRAKGFRELLNDLCVTFCVKYCGRLLLGPKSFYKRRESEVEEQCLHALVGKSCKTSVRGFFYLKLRKADQGLLTVQIFVSFCFQRWGSSMCSFVACFAFCRCMLADSLYAS